MATKERYVILATHENYDWQDFPKNFRRKKKKELQGLLFTTMPLLWYKFELQKQQKISSQKLCCTLVERFGSEEQGSTCLSEYQGISYQAAK